MESCSERPDGILCSADRRRNVHVYWKRDIDSAVLCNAGSSSSLAIFNALWSLPQHVLPRFHSPANHISSANYKLSTADSYKATFARSSFRRTAHLCKSGNKLHVGWKAHAPAHTGGDERRMRGTPNSA